jgi:phosphonatase-like hydrolase
MHSQNIELAIFDMAGTTVHDENFVTKTLCEALALHGYHGVTLEAANSVMGIAKPVAIKMLLDLFYPAEVNPPVAAIHDDFLKSMINFYTTAPEVMEMKGATDTFIELKKMGIKIGLDTGFSRDITDIIIKRLGWDRPEILDISVSSDEVAQGRPYPDMIYKAMEILNIKDTKKVAKIGDTPVDLQEGSNASCGLVIGVLSGSADKETLLQYPHTHLAGSVVEIPGIIHETNSAIASTSLSNHHGL